MAFVINYYIRDIKSPRLSRLGGPGLFCFPGYASRASFTWALAALRVSNQFR